MEWESEAEKALSKVPFFVRKRVRKRVEEEAERRGGKTVTLEHMRTCQKRFLSRMEEEVKGYQVETCFGPSGCPNRAVSWEGVAEKLEKRLARRDMKRFLKDRVQGPLKMHHEFRISVSDCPNACSRPQIVDIGLIGACRPQVTQEPCSECGACVEACKENAMTLQHGGPKLDESKCLLCGQCIKACPTGTLREGSNGYRVLVGGKLGRHPRLGKEIACIDDLEGVVEFVDRCLDHYQRHCTQGERFGEILERTGLAELETGEKIVNRP